MGLIKCIECKKEISSQAKSCPHCGYNFKKKKKWFIQILTKILYKAIPREFYKVKNSIFVLPFGEALYTYYIPRYGFPSLDKTADMEFLTLNGDAISVHFFTIPVPLDSNELKSWFDGEQRFMKALNMLKETVHAGWLKDNRTKIINESIFDNGFWKGAILELIREEDEENVFKMADIIFGGFDLYICFSIFVPNYSSKDLIPEDLYSENVKFFKLCRIPENILRMQQKVCGSLKNE